MIKYFISAFVLLLISGSILFFFNTGLIYKLTDNTAQFIPLQEIPSGTISLKARDCGVCHTAIYQEWQESLHSRAYIDPFFTAYHKKDNGDPTCLVCQTPLENQAPEILYSKSGEFHDLKSIPNPKFDQALQQEGVTCAGCHVRNGIIYGPFRQKTMNAPHAVAYDEKFTSKNICQQCHEVPAKSISLMDEGICRTGMESDNGVWAARGFICQDCHMQAVKRPLMAGFPAREGRKHLWPGGYSSSQLKKVFSFKAEKNQQQLTIMITNSGAGHKAPTGDPDRFIVLDFYWIDESGHETALASIEFKRQIIWQPIMFVWSDNRLAPGESTSLTLSLPSGSGKLYVNGSYHIMTDRSLNRLKEKFELQNEWPIHRPFIVQQQIRFD